MKCWGRNDRGQLGYGDTDWRDQDDASQMGNNLPVVDLGTDKTAVYVSVGGLHTCAVLNDGNAKCWGAGNDGKLGYGDTDNRGGGPNEMGEICRM